MVKRQTILLLKCWRCWTFFTLSIWIAWIKSRDEMIVEGWERARNCQSTLDSMMRFWRMRENQRSPERARLMCDMIIVIHGVWKHEARQNLVECDKKCQSAPDQRVTGERHQLNCGVTSKSKPPRNRSNPTENWSRCHSRWNNTSKIARIPEVYYQ